MAASASTGAAEVAVISESMASIVRRELVTEKFKSGAAIDATTLDFKRSQLVAFDAAREGKRSRAAKWSSRLHRTVKLDGNTTRALVTSEAVETRAALALVAENARVGSAAAVDALAMLMGKDAGMRTGQTDKERLKECRSIKTQLNNECLEICEREAVRKRDLLGETPAARASREGRVQAAATRTEEAKTAKEEKVKKRKADALEKKEEKVEKRKADALEKKEEKMATARSGRASSSTTSKSKPKPKAEPRDSGRPVSAYFKKQTRLADFTEGLAELLSTDAPVPYSHELMAEAIQCKQSMDIAFYDMERLIKVSNYEALTQHDREEADDACAEVQERYKKLKSRYDELAAAGYTATPEQTRSASDPVPTPVPTPVPGGVAAGLMIEEVSDDATGQEATKENVQTTGAEQAKVEPATTGAVEQLAPVPGGVADHKTEEKKGVDEQKSEYSYSEDEV
jgi:hypothetical protein